MMGKEKTGCSRNAGQAVVEFALVLPLFLLLILAAIEFGRAYFTLHVLNNAARDGCRIAILPGSTADDVDDRIEAFLQKVKLDWESCRAEVVAVDPDGVERASLADAQQGDSIEVTVEYDFTIVVGSIIPGFQGTKTLSSACVFRHE